VFGQDATGGMAAFWLVRAGEPVAAQPVVFLGSEGDVAVVARDLGSYLWLLAAGFGPLEAAMHPDHESEPVVDERLVALARRCAPTVSSDVAELLGAARAEFPDVAEAVLR
jgi:hypothetical protein